MASYCPKCGSEISMGSQFCARCGAPAGATAPVSATPPAGTAPPYTPVPQPPYGTPTAAPPPARGNALKIVLIVVAIVVGLGIIGAGIVGYTAYRIARGVHVNSSTGEVSINTPQGKLSASSRETFTSAELGIDIYPGATAAEGGMRMTVPDGNMITGVYTTSDSQDQVVAFYKGKVNSDASIMETGEGAVITAKTGENESIIITVTANSGRNEGKTRIQIVHTTSNKAS